jgi:peroxiredoxin
VALGPSVLHNVETHIQEEDGHMALKVGDLAPDFELPAVEGEQRLKIKLSDFRGKKHVVVTFHPLNWTPT